MSDLREAQFAQLTRPGSAPALVVVAVAWAVTTRVLHGGPLVWTPLPVPTVPVR